MIYFIRQMRCVSPLAVLTRNCPLSLPRSHFPSLFIPSYFSVKRAQNGHSWHLHVACPAVGRTFTSMHMQYVTSNQALEWLELKCLPGNSCCRVSAEQNAKWPPFSASFLTVPDWRQVCAQSFSRLFWVSVMWNGPYKARKHGSGQSNSGHLASTE